MDGPLKLRIPRDREATVEPQLVKKNQARIIDMDNQILSLYAKGMTTRERETAAAFKEPYDADVSPSLVSKVADAVIEQVVKWQNRPLDAIYPIVYLGCTVHMVRNSLRFVSWKGYKAVTRDLKAIYQAPQEAGLQALEALSSTWDSCYPQISRSWQVN